MQQKSHIDSAYICEEASLFCVVLIVHTDPDSVLYDTHEESVNNTENLIVRVWTDSS